MHPNQMVASNLTDFERFSITAMLVMVLAQTMSLISKFSHQHPQTVTNIKMLPSLLSPDLTGGT